jgi:hypothetical protein
VHDLRLGRIWIYDLAEVKVARHNTYGPWVVRWFEMIAKSAMERATVPASSTGHHALLGTQVSPHHVL